MPPVTDVSDGLTERYGLTGPASDEEVGVGRREGRLETGDPVAVPQQGARSPDPVPAADHALDSSLGTVWVEELPGSSTRISGRLRSDSSQDERYLLQRGVVVAREESVVEAGVDDLVLGDDQGGVLHTVDPHPAVVLGAGVLRVTRDLGRSRTTRHVWIK